MSSIELFRTSGFRAYWVTHENGVRELKLDRIKTKKMDKLKKYLDTFYWYDKTNKEILDDIPAPIMSLEYPSTFRTHFGNAPCLFLQVTDKIMPIENRVKFEKYLIAEGFHIYECSTSEFKYTHQERGIVVRGEFFAKQLLEEGEEESVRSNNEGIVYLSVLPSIENKDFISKILKKVIKSFMDDVPAQQDKFYMIAQNQSGLYTQRTSFKSIPIKDDRFDLFYGENFPHEKMKNFISGETENLMLIHGDPGTGKSNYIKHIITNSAKKVIYIPPSMLSVLSTPGFVSFVMENKNSILLIEDAEEVLSTDRNSATNNLLGLTDGFLKDALNLKIICTFNCEIGRIDPALMRKGRMYFEYKFDVLTTQECQKLADYMGLNTNIDKPMTLAEVFNREDNSVKNSFEDRRIGFC